jgi:hypothetical protein
MTRITSGYVELFGHHLGDRMLDSDH